MSDKLKADVLSAFNGGELTPEVSGRVDREELKFGTRYSSNFIPTHQGGISKWYGTTKIDTIPLNVSSKYVLVPFNGASEPLALLFYEGNVYAVSGQEVYLQDFNVGEDQIVGASYLQINDLVYFANQNTSFFQIQYYGMENGHHIFKLYNTEIKEEPFFPYSWNGNYNKNLQTDGYAGVVNVTATSAVSGYNLKLPTPIRDPGSELNVVFQSDRYTGISGGTYSGKNTDTPYTVTMGATLIKLVRDRSGVETDIISSYIGNQKILKETWSYEIYVYAGSGGGVAYMKKETRWSTKSVFLKVINKTQILQAFSSVGATSISDGKLYFSTLPAGHVNGDKYKIVIQQAASSSNAPQVDGTVSGYNRAASAPAYTASGALEELVQETYSFDSLDIVGRKIRFHVPTSSAVQSWAQNITVEANKVYYSDGNYYIARMSTATATTGTMQPVHRSGTKSDGNVNFEYFHSGYGIGTIISVPDSTHMQIQVDNVLPVLDITSANYNFDMYQWSMWGYKNRYPSMLFTYANRLGCILDTDGYGVWLQMSKTDAYDDFGTEEYGQQLDTSAINMLVTGHFDNHITWVLSGYRLYMGSYAGEYNVEGDKSTGSLTPINIRILPVSGIGGARVDAVKYKDMNIFVGATDEELYRLQYDYSSDDYVPEELSTISENLFSEGVKRMHVLSNKDRNLYFLSNENKLRLCSIQEEIKTMGCYRVDVSGDIIDFTISSSNGISCGFIVVNRDNIVTVERIDSQNPSYMLSARNIQTLTTDPVIEATVTDTEFAGKEIFVKDETTGMFYHTSVDSDGVFANRFETHSLTYGLPLVAEVHTLPPYNQNNKLEGLQQKAVKFNIRVLESGEFSYGSSNDFDKWYEYHNWNTQAGQSWNAPHELMSGDLQLPASFGYMQVNNKADGKYPNTTGIAINLRSSSPEPFNLLMVSNLYV